MPPITPSSKNVSAAPHVKKNAEPGKPLSPQRQKSPSAGILTDAVYQLQTPPPAPPPLPPGAAPLAPASTFQAPAQANTQQPHPAQQSTQAPADALSDADKREIDRWLSDNDPASTGEIVDKLRSLSKPEQELSKPRQRYLIARQQYLIDRAFNLDKQASRNLIPFSRVGDLVKRVRHDAPTLQRVVAERLMNCAINSQRRLEGDGSLDDPHNQARACALHALDAMHGNRELGQLVSSLEDGALFGQALGNGNRFYNGVMSEARNRVLAALNSVPHTETSAVVGTLCSQTVPTDISPRSAESIATALAREWRPDSPENAAPEVKQQNEETRYNEKKRLKDLMESRQGVQLLFGGSPDRNLTTLLTIQNSPLTIQNRPRITAQALAHDAGEWIKSPVVAQAMADRLVPSDAPDRGATVTRMAGILAIDQGQQLLFGQYGFDDRIAAAARTEALQALLSDSSITAQTLTETDAWTNPQLVTDIAQHRAAQAGIRNDEPTQFNGRNDFSNFAGRAMGLLPPDEDNLDGLLGVITGSKSVYPQENVQAIVDAVIKVGGLKPRVTFWQATFSNHDTGPVQFAMFRVETGVCKISSDGSYISEAVYVDHLGGVHKTIGDGVAAPGTKKEEPKGWLQNNKLPEGGVVVYPKNGHLNTDPSGALIFGHADTPRHPVKNVVNFAALVGGIVAGGMVILGSGGTGALLLGAGCSAWGLNNVREELAYRADHHQSNSLRNADARALWLGLAANATGVAAFAYGALLGPLAAQAGWLRKVSALTIGGVNWAATVTNGAAFINGGIDLVMNPPEHPLMAILDLAFQATVSVVGARHAGGLGEVFNPVANVRRITEAYRPHVERTSALPGNRVQIENVNGRRVIFASPTAPQELIDLHVEIARMMALDQGIIAMLARRVFGGARPGRLAYAVQWELIKLGKLTELLNARLNEPNLTPQQRDLFKRDIGIVRAYGERVIRLLADHPNAGEIPVASPDTASASYLEALGDNARDVLKKLAGRAAAAEHVAATKAIREYYEALKTVSGPEAALDRVSLQMMIDAYELVPGHDADLVAEVKKYLNDLVGKENIADLFKPVAASRGPSAAGSVAQGPADIDLDNFFPNPKAPNGPALLKHDRIARAVGRIITVGRKMVGKLLRRSPSYDGADTYKKLYDKAPPELRKFLPAPGTFRVDDNTVALAEFVGGLERLIADIHAHPYGYDRRSPWNDLILGLKHGTDALIDLLKVTDENAIVAIEAIAQGCGSPGGYYADANPGPLKQVAELDRRVAEIYLAVYGRGPAGQALAAKGHISMTGFDFSEKTGVLDRYRAATKAYYDAMADPLNSNDRRTIQKRFVQFDIAYDVMTAQRELGVVSPQADARYQAAAEALKEAISKRTEEYPDLDKRSPLSVREVHALEEKAAAAFLELRAYETEATAQSADPVTHTLNMWKRYPGVFSLFGEITANKELVGQALGAGKWDISNPKFKRWLDFLATQNIKAPIVLHSDWGHAGLNEAGRPAAVQMAYENIPEIVRVFGEAKYRDLNVIFAHTGIGRYVRPNARLVEVSAIDRSTGQRVTRHVPEPIAMLYQVAEKVPNAKFDISWNDVTQAYADSPELKKALVDFIVDNQDRVLFGSDTVKPVNTGHYNQALYTAAPIFAEIARQDPEALWKLLRGNSEKLLNEGAASVADWTHKNLSDPKALAAMDERNKILGDHRARMLRGARADFDKWVAEFKKLGSPSPSSNPGFFPAFFMSHPDAHDHDPPLEGANPAYGPVGRGTPGGYVNEPPDANPIAAQAVRNNKIATAGITAAGVGAGAAAMDHIGDHADALAFLGRGAAIAVRALYTENLRLSWELIFEEGHVTRDNLNTFVSGIFDAAGPLQITDEQKLLIAGATEQFLANYEALAAQPVESYRSIDGTIEGKKAQRFNAIMAKVAEYQVSVDRILGMQASSINPLDARTPLGKMYRAIVLGTYLVNDVAAVEWLAHGKLNLSTPEGKAEAAYHILFFLGNAGMTGVNAKELSNGLTGRLDTTTPFFKDVLRKYSNWALTLGGTAWTANDAMIAYNNALAGGMTGQAGVDSVKVMLDLAFTYGVYRISGFEAAKVGGAPTPHVRNLAWATAVTGGALVLREIIREIEDQKKKKSDKPANGAPAATPATPPPPAMPHAAPAATMP
jgi:hypothetical protein